MDLRARTTAEASGRRGARGGMQPRNEDRGLLSVPELREPASPRTAMNTPREVSGGGTCFPFFVFVVFVSAGDGGW